MFPRGTAVHPVKRLSHRDVRCLLLQLHAGLFALYVGIFVNAAAPELFGLVCQPFEEREWTVRWKQAETPYCTVDEGASAEPTRDDKNHM